MEELLKELRDTIIREDYEVDFYNGVIYALWRLNKIDTAKKIGLENAIKLRLLEIK